MNKDDIDKIVGEVTAHNYSLTRYGSLLVNETYYWLASEYTESSIWNIDGKSFNLYGGTVYYNNNNYNKFYGIRAKVTLVEGGRRNVSLQQCKNLQGGHGARPYTF